MPSKTKYNSRDRSVILKCEELRKKLGIAKLKVASRCQWSQKMVDTDFWYGKYTELQDMENKKNEEYNKNLNEIQKLIQEDEDSDSDSYEAEEEHVPVEKVLTNVIENTGTGKIKNHGKRYYVAEKTEIISQLKDEILKDLPLRKEKRGRKKEKPEEKKAGKQEEKPEEKPAEKPEEKKEVEPYKPTLPPIPEKIITRTRSVSPSTRILPKNTSHNIHTSGATRPAVLLNDRDIYKYVNYSF